MKRTEQTIFRRFFTSRIFLVVCLVFLAFLVFGYSRAYYQDYKLRKEIKSLQEQADSLEKKHFESLELLKFVSSPEYVEETARNELNMKKEGENVVVVTDTAVQKTFVSSTDQAPVVPLNNPIKWWYYFIHKQINN